MSEEGTVNASDSDLITFVRREMNRLGYNQAQLAAHAGISKQTVSFMLTGKRTPDPLTCQKLAYALECEPELLLRLAGHDIPKEPDSEKDWTSKALLRRAIVSIASVEIPTEAIEKMVAACDEVIQDISSKYDAALLEELAAARKRLDKLDFDYRAIDPLTSSVLTAVFIRDVRVSYVTGKLNREGDEIYRSEISHVPVDDVEWVKQRSKYQLQVWPQAMYASGAGLTAREDNPFAIHFWIPEYGRQEMAWQFRAVLPDGSDEAVQDRLVRKLREQRVRRIAKQFPETMRIEKYAEEIAAKERAILSGQALKQPREVFINPDTLSYLVLLAEVGGAIYWLLEGKLADMTKQKWTANVLGGHTPPHRHAGTHGFWPGLVSPGGYCLNVWTHFPVPQHSSLGRQYKVSQHFVLRWEKHGDQCFGIASLDMGTWRVLGVNRSEDDFMGVEVDDEVVKAGSHEDRRAALEEVLKEKMRTLKKQGLHYEILPVDPGDISDEVWSLR